MLNLLNAKNLLIGTGKVEGGNPLVNFGALKGNVRFNHEPKVEEIKMGIPQQVVKSYKAEETASLTASIAEFSVANLKLLCGGKLGGGGLESLPEISPFVFTHEREEDLGVEIRFHKVKIETGLEMNFDETGLALSNVTFKAIADATKPKGLNLYTFKIFDVTKADAEAVGTGDGSTTTFALDHTSVIETSGMYVTVAGTPTSAFTMNYETGSITFTTAPANSAPILATYYYRTLIEEAAG